ncbi:hypothetical protein V8C37DRAFT_394690 [Trichoderma ceciliae]
MESHHLPSHYQLYTALIPPSPSPAAIRTTSNESISIEPSSARHSNWRRQLLALHVIFPSLLLPALDLLDRGLVTRLLVGNKPQGALETTATSHAGILEGGEAEPTQGHSTGRVPSSRQEMNGKNQICLYTVQSAASASASATSRRKRHKPQASKAYAVHLDAWSCSCGGFALDAYSNHHVTNDTEQLQRSTPPGCFGNLALDGRLGLQEDFPCCKHLLACLLAEKWKGSPRSHVEDKYTTKEELAAIIGGP